MYSSRMLKGLKGTVFLIGLPIGAASASEYSVANKAGFGGFSEIADVVRYSRISLVSAASFSVDDQAIGIINGTSTVFDHTYEAANKAGGAGELLNLDQFHAAGHEIDGRWLEVIETMAEAAEAGSTYEISDRAGGAGELLIFNQLLTASYVASGSGFERDVAIVASAE